MKSRLAFVLFALLVVLTPALAATPELKQQQPALSQGVNVPYSSTTASDPPLPTA